MSKHTPGPWLVSCDGTRVLAFTPVDMDDQRPCPDVVDCASGHSSMSYDEAKANAALIAAAPDLLAALEKIVFDEERRRKDLRHNSLAAKFCDARLDAARAAIAKAKGE